MEVLLVMVMAAFAGLAGMLAGSSIVANKIYSEVVKATPIVVEQKAYVCKPVALK